MGSDRQGRERRCLPCTAANVSAGLFLAWLPVAAALLYGGAILVALAVAWGVLVTGYTLYRLVRPGYLPYAEFVARRTGLHDRVGPGARSGPDDPPGRDE